VLGSNATAVAQYAKTAKTSQGNIQMTEVKDIRNIGSLMAWITENILDDERL